MTIGHPSAHFTMVGGELSLIVPLPSCPTSFPPQQVTVPSLTAQTW
jgi:hypothetical protein